MSLLKPRTAHVELVGGVTGGRLSEPDALAWMALLHTHKVILRSTAVNRAWQQDAKDGVVALEAQTQRGVAAVVAKLWTKTAEKDDKRRNYTYWHREFNTRLNCEVAESIPTFVMPRVEELRLLLKGDSRVVDVVAED
jgi:hypothetical protein